MLVLLISAAYSERFTGYSNKIRTLQAGEYNISCGGAQGGNSPQATGGPGATGYGILHVKDSQTYKAEPGSQGKTEGTSNGGSPDGGNGDDPKIGGGGSSSFYLDETNLVLNCAGGGGAAAGFNGSPGGDEKYFLVPKPQNKFLQVEHVESKSSTSGKGSGGGGGKPIAGIVGKGWREPDRYSLLGLGIGGKSYVKSGVFKEYKIFSGAAKPNNGDGYIEITPIYQCGLNCRDCNSATNCILCRDNYKIYNGVCYSDCPARTFFNTSDNRCQLCPDGCSECSDSNVCGGCIDGYFLKSNQCQKCMTGCKKCNAENQCEECNYGFKKENNKCQKICEAGQFPDGDICRRCSSHCDKCSNANQCSKCKEGFYLNNGQCMQCAEGCDICTSNDQCSRCSIGYTLNNNKCERKCPANCKECPDSNTCTTCNEGYVLKENRCQQCMNGCKRCNTTDYCLECSSPSMQLRNGKCLQKRTFGFNENIDGIGSFQVFARRINNR